MSRGILVEVQFVTNDIGEDLARLSGFQCQVETGSGLNALVAKNAPDEFVLAGTVLEDKGACRMPELVHGDP